jgi:flagellar biosynthesis anti-sigma factor FlgM
MRIPGDSPIKAYRQQQVAPAANEKREKPRAGGAESAEHDAITLSPRTQEILTVRQKIVHAPEDKEREARVEAIREQVEAGTYEVHGREIAVKLLQSGQLKRDI